MSETTLSQSSVELALALRETDAQLALVAELLRDLEAREKLLIERQRALHQQLGQLLRPAVIARKPRGKRQPVQS